MNCMAICLWSPVLLEKGTIAVSSLVGEGLDKGTILVLLELGTILAVAGAKNTKGLIYYNIPPKY